MLAAQRYAQMTEAVAAQHPAFVVWPETVILTDMTRDTGARAAFGALAKRLGFPIFVGTVTSDAQGRLYNTSLIFDRTGNVEASSRNVSSFRSPSSCRRRSGYARFRRSTRSGTSLKVTVRRSIRSRMRAS